MDFQKFKHGNIAVLLLICMAVLLISSYMILNTLQLNKESIITTQDYQEQLNKVSTYEICASVILDILDGRTFYYDDYVLTNSDLMVVKIRVKELTNQDIDIDMSCPTALFLTSLICEIDNHIIILDNIQQNINEESEEITLDMSRVNIKVETKGS